MPYVLENPDNGERVWSQDKEGYDGWTVVAEVNGKPKEHGELDEATGEWVVDTQKKAKEERRAFLQTLNTEQLVDQIESLMDIIDERLAVVEENTGLRQARRNVKPLRISPKNVKE